MIGEFSTSREGRRDEGGSRAIFLRSLRQGYIIDERSIDERVSVLSIGQRGETYVTFDKIEPVRCNKTDNKNKSPNDSDAHDPISRQYF